MLPDVDLAQVAGAVRSVAEADELEVAIATVGNEEIGCAANLRQDALEGPHVDGSQ